MTDSEKQEVEKDEGSSLEKRIEHLSKDDPEYELKRDKLLELLSIRKKDFKLLHEKTKKQQKELLNTLKVLHMEQEKNPNDPELMNLIETVKLDTQFIIRARMEAFAHNNEINDKSKVLDASKSFNIATDLQVPTELKLKPLPSEQVETTKGKAKSLPEKNRKKKAALKIHKLRNSEIKSRSISLRGNQNHRSIA